MASLSHELDELLAYLEGNPDVMIYYFRAKIPGMKISKPQSTYLAWPDCRKLDMKQSELADLFINKARVGLNEGFMRLNAACPRSLPEEALKRIEQAVKKR